MPAYKAPLDDIRFVLYELLKADQRSDIPELAKLDRETVDAVLEGAAQICEEVLQPLNQTGDEIGCVWENGVVRTPPGFKEAYRQFCEGGWNGLGAPEEYGGAGLPILVNFVLSEMMFSANQSFGMYPGLTAAAYSALMATGQPWMKQHIVPKMVAGTWSGTMCLTEPHCGTDLRLMKTKAVEQPDGTYRLSGTKIFISGGEHDMADNIIHMVIAKIPDEDGRVHDDLSTVNFFMVPKFIVNEDGTTGARNGVFCGSIEKKMGIKASATAVLNFDEAVAWRLGPKPQPKKEGEKRSSSEGMKGMFGMMNAARMGVGIQGIGIAEVAMQNGVTYAKERLAGRALTGPAEPEKPADPLLVHPDVRRMLLFCKSFVQGARALAMTTTFLMSVARGAPAAEERQAAADLTDLLTPIIKAHFTDLGFDAANAAMQVYGGHGYIRDWGMEQFVRDARINQVYEGANGVQAMDLVGRKLARNGGRAVLGFFAEVKKELAAADGPAYIAKPLADALSRLESATVWLMENGLKDPNNAGAAAVDYLRLFGHVAVGWQWLKMARIAETALAAGKGSAAFYEEKRVLARFWGERMLPESLTLEARIRQGGEGIMMLEAANF